MNAVLLKLHRGINLIFRQIAPIIPLIPLIIPQIALIFRRYAEYFLNENLRDLRYDE